MRHRNHGVFLGGLAVVLSASAAPAHSAEQTRRDGAGGHAHERPHGDAIGMPGDPARASRTVPVDMTDTMRFVPAKVAVRHGETIRFVVRNTGRLQHEFVLGTVKELQAHGERMKKFPEMAHADPNMVTVAPGKSGDVVWTFTRSGRVDFACLQPGHYEAGMKGAVTVGAAKRGADPHAGHRH